MKKNPFVQFIREIYTEFREGHVSALSYFKYYRKWSHSLQPGKTAIADEQPWISYPAIDFLERSINEQTVAFEYGCGGSTLFFANRVKKLISVEHDPYWFNQLTDRLNSKGKPNWTSRLVLPEKHDSIPELDPSEPMDYYTNDETYADCTFRSYACAIDEYPDQYFDLVLVDGRCRPSCISHSISKIKPGGLLIVDNTNRKHYFKVFNELLPAHFSLLYNQRAPSPYASYFTRTGLWRKLL